jgi:hypothetical protein
LAGVESSPDAHRLISQLRFHPKAIQIAALIHHAASMTKTLIHAQIAVSAEAAEWLGPMTTAQGAHRPAIRRSRLSRPR